MVSFLQDNEIDSDWVRAEVLENNEVGNKCRSRAEWAERQASTNKRVRNERAWGKRFVPSQQ
jgi:hypothetical protein